MPRKKIICVGKCFICKTKHYAHLGGWVINGSDKLLCYELDYETGQLRKDCFTQAQTIGRSEMDVTFPRPGSRSGEDDTTALLGLLKEDLQ